MRRVHVYRTLMVKEATLGTLLQELPGCVSVWDDVGDAARMAHDALSLHRAGMSVDREVLLGKVALDAPLPRRLVLGGLPIEDGRVLVGVKVTIESAEP